MHHGGPAAHGVSFHRHCPVCGRGLIINVRLLGSRVYCQHCGGGFVATDPAVGPSPSIEEDRSRRVDDLLRQAARRLCRDEPIETLVR